MEGKKGFFVRERRLKTVNGTSEVDGQRDRGRGEKGL